MRRLKHLPPLLGLLLLVGAQFPLFAQVPQQCIDLVTVQGLATQNQQWQALVDSARQYVAYCSNVQMPVANQTALSLNNIGIGLTELVATTRFLCRGFLIGLGGRMCLCHTSIGCGLRTESSLLL